MMEVGCLLVTLVLLCWAMVARPAGAQCPPRWYMNGVRPSGAFECRPAAAGNPDNDGTWGHPDTTPFNPLVIAGQIYCPPPTVPLLIDDRTVGCRRVPGGR